MPSVRPGGARVPLLALLVLFFLSGASALVYQVLWMRLLALVFGVTVHAASTVLAAFMMGLALGSAAAGRLADRLARPLHAFAAAEALIAVAALATPVLFGAIEDLYVVLHGVLGGVPGLLTLIRFLLSFAVLLVPTTLMGATLPLIVKAALGRGAILGRQVSLLYAVNTAGAISGALIAGVWLVPQLGMAWSFRLGAVTNLTVAALAVLVAMATRSDARPAAQMDEILPGADPAPTSPFIPSAVVRRLVLLTFAVSGFGSFALEIVWFRMLVVLLRPTTYAFTVMLATVLAGIAIGSWIATPLVTRQRPHPVAVLAALEVLLALTAVLSMGVIGQAALVYGWAAPFFQGGALAYFGPMAMTSIAAILPPALLMGMAFPIGISIWASDVTQERAGERVGFIYAVNVTGAVAGSLLTGFVLLPLAGSRATLLLIAALTFTMGVLLLAQLPRRSVALGAGAIAAALFVLLASRTPDPVMALLRSRYPSEAPVWREEDGHATVAILRHTSAGRAINRLYINGMHQASDQPGMVAYHRMIGTLPMAIHPNPRNALVIGAGGGATPGAVAAFSDRTLVDVVELSPAVLRAARRFSSINAALLVRPNVRLRVDDGRNYMLLTDQRYDVITADVILPMHAGAGNLYSVQYYKLMKEVLRSRGIALQWIGSGTETEYKLIMRTFLRVFPHTTLWEGGTLMVGAKRPLRLDPEAFERKLQRLESRSALRSMGLDRFDDLLGKYVAGPDELRAFVGEGPILTDERPLTEYFLSLPENDRPVDLSAVRGNVQRHVLASPSTRP